MSSKAKMEFRNDHNRDLIDYCLPQFPAQRLRFADTVEVRSYWIHDKVGYQRPNSVSTADTNFHHRGKNQEETVNARTWVFTHKQQGEYCHCVTSFLERERAAGRSHRGYFGTSIEGLTINSSDESSSSSSSSTSSDDAESPSSPSLRTKIPRHTPFSPLLFRLLFRLESRIDQLKHFYAPSLLLTTRRHLPRHHRKLFRRLGLCVGAFRKYIRVKLPKYWERESRRRAGCGALKWRMAIQEEVAKCEDRIERAVRRYGDPPEGVDGEESDETVDEEGEIDSQEGYEADTEKE